MVPLGSSRVASAPAAYEHARQLFLHGHLESSQEEAERGYRKFKDSNTEFAVKFEFLAAEAMAWRGMYEDTLRVLSAINTASASTEYRIRQLVLEGVASAHLQRFTDAERVLAEAVHLCEAANQAACGEVPRAQGQLAFARGDFVEANRLFLESLDLAHQHHDRLMEATAFLNLGSVCLETSRYDEALNWSRSAYQAGVDLNEENQIQAALGDLGWAYLRLGDPDKAMNLFQEAKTRAAKLGNIRDELKWFTTIGYLYTSTAQIEPAARSYGNAYRLAKRINSKEDLLNISTDLALVAVESGRATETEKYASQAYKLAEQSGSRPDMMDAVAIQMQAAALRGDTGRAKQLLHEVEAAPESQASMKWASELAMARLYETQSQDEAAQAEYTTALGTFEAARAELQHEDSQLPFVANATRIYDDYIHFLVKQGRVEEALLAADQSRARTLAQGLGDANGQHGAGSNAAGGVTAGLSPQAVARKAKATLLFYWLGEKQSYLWAITPQKTLIFPLPAKAELTARVERYTRALQGPEDPVAAGNADGRALYEALVAPAKELIGAGAPVLILADGALCQLNFETLIAPGMVAAIAPGIAPGIAMGMAPADKEHGREHAAAHYWIEDATVASAPSLAMLAAARPSRAPLGNLLLMGDAISPDPSYPRLEFASAEMTQIQKHFRMAERAVYSGAQATPGRYLASNPGQYAYIHFVSHGVASQSDPLDSAIILSRAGAGEDSFKLYAREIMQHSIDARLVTISACYGSGTRAYAGEGLVGLSWAFLHAGAHNAIGALWEASDRSTAQLMDGLYRRLEAGDAPEVALRRAKLDLLHAESGFRKPFYWAAFQVYTRL